MANAKPGIPPPPSATESGLRRTLEATRINIEIITGARGGRLLTLPPTATTAEIIDKINEIIARLNV